jgi:hypothetical protein
MDRARVAVRFGEVHEVRQETSAKNYPALQISSRGGSPPTRRSLEQLRLAFVSTVVKPLIRQRRAERRGRHVSTVTHGSPRRPLPHHPRNTFAIRPAVRQANYIHNTTQACVITTKVGGCGRSRP